MLKTILPLLNCPATLIENLLTSGNFLAVLRLGLCAFAAEDPGSIPVWRTKILQAMWHWAKKKKNQQLTLNVRKGLFLNFQFYSVDLYGWSLCQSHTVLLTVALCNKFWKQNVWVISFFPPRLFWLFLLACIATWILGPACHFLQRSLLEFHGDCIQSINYHLNNIKSSDPWLWDVFPFI